jgi:hypothetical protein
MNTPESTTSASLASQRIREPWFAPKLPASGAWFFLRAALLIALYFGVDWFRHRNDSPPPDLNISLRGGGLFVTLFLVLALGFYLWERRLNRQMREHRATRNERETAKNRNA